LTIFRKVNLKREICLVNVLQLIFQEIKLFMELGPLTERPWAGSWEDIVETRQTFTIIYSITHTDGQMYAHTNVQAGCISDSYIYQCTVLGLKVATLYARSAYLTVEMIASSSSKVDMLQCMLG
jgi:hypothetical protein